VVVAGTLAEAFLVSVRCAWDALAMGLAVAACGKNGQAPDDSMRALLNWAKKNQRRVHTRLMPILESDAGWFWSVRTFRDDLIHHGSHAFIFWNGEEFLLSLLARFDGSPNMEPLLPLMASISEHLLAFAHSASEAVQDIIPLPPERRRSMVLHSPFVPYLNSLRKYWASPPATRE